MHLLSFRKLNGLILGGQGKTNKHRALRLPTLTDTTKYTNYLVATFKDALVYVSFLFNHYLLGLVRLQKYLLAVGFAKTILCVVVTSNNVCVCGINYYLRRVKEQQPAKVGSFSTAKCIILTRNSYSI